MGVGLFLAAVAAFVGARRTSVFAVDSIAVRGASPAVEQQVEQALRPFLGVSLLRIDRAALEQRLGGVAWVASSELDRSFPHTLVVTVRPERPVVVLRGGARAWLVSSRARVLRRLPLGARPTLPRVWAGPAASPTVGMTLGDTPGGRAARAVAPLAWVRFPARVASVAAGEDELTLVLRSGLHLRLGDANDLKLKLAVARRVLPILGPASPGSYLDVSVPERPVAATNPRVEGRGSE